MQDILPRSVLAGIESRIRNRIEDAEYGYQFSEADEDSVTGALGQMLLSRPLEAWDPESDSQYVWSITYRKIRGRGKNAPEKRTGADGIFEIQVTNAMGSVMRQKGLLFQAKNRPGNDKKLQEQEERLHEYANAAIVINYSRNGYSARVLNIHGLHEYEPRRHSEAISRPLREVLASDFLHCRIGMRGLRYDPIQEMVVVDETSHRLAGEKIFCGNDIHVVSLEVRQYPA